jgi:hypothetical protein
MQEAGAAKDRHGLTVILYTHTHTHTHTHDIRTKKRDFISGMPTLSGMLQLGYCVLEGTDARQDVKLLRLIKVHAASASFPLGLSSVISEVRIPHA